MHNNDREFGVMENELRPEPQNSFIRRVGRRIKDFARPVAVPVLSRLQYRMQVAVDGSTVSRDTNVIKDQLSAVQERLNVMESQSSSLHHQSDMMLNRLAEQQEKVDAVAAGLLNVSDALAAGMLNVNDNLAVGMLKVNDTVKAGTGNVNSEVKSLIALLQCLRVQLEASRADHRAELEARMNDRKILLDLFARSGVSAHVGHDP